MKVNVLGLGHLGCVTTACYARYFEVKGLDSDGDRIGHLKQGKSPLSKSGLDDLFAEGQRTVRNAKRFLDQKLNNITDFRYPGVGRVQ